MTIDELLHIQHLYVAAFGHRDREFYPCDEGMMECSDDSGCYLFENCDRPEVLELVAALLQFAHDNKGDRPANPQRRPMGKPKLSIVS